MQLLRPKKTPCRYRNGDDDDSRAITLATVSLASEAACDHFLARANGRKERNVTTVIKLMCFEMLDKLERWRSIPSTVARYIDGFSIVFAKTIVGSNRLYEVLGITSLHF